MPLSYFNIDTYRCGCVSPLNANTASFYLGHIPTGDAILSKYILFDMRGPRVTLGTNRQGPGRGIAKHSFQLGVGLTY